MKKSDHRIPFYRLNSVCLSVSKDFWMHNQMFVLLYFRQTAVAKDGSPRVSLKNLGSSCPCHLHYHHTLATSWQKRLLWTNFHLELDENVSCSDSILLCINCGKQWRMKLKHSPFIGLIVICIQSHKHLREPWTENV